MNTDFYERYKYAYNKPQISNSAFIAPSADIIGDVTIKDHASVWYGAVIRADIEKIFIDEYSNVQDGCIIHLSDTLGTKIGKWVTCGHKAVLHACEIEDEVLIGMGAIILDGAKIGKRSIIGANSLVTMNTQIPEGSLVLGSPAKVIKKLSQKEQNDIKNWAQHYVDASKVFKNKSPEYFSNKDK